MFHGWRAQTYTASTCALCFSRIWRRLSFWTAVSMSLSGVHSSSISTTLVGISNLCSPDALHTACTSLSTASSSLGSTHIAASSPSTPSSAAVFLSVGMLGQMSAMQYDIDEVACTIGSAVNLDDLIAFSTLESATYSPICSLTRSFFRSMICRLPRGVNWPMSPVQKYRMPSIVTKSSWFFATISGSGSLASTRYPCATVGPPMRISPRRMPTALVRSELR
mmetsp:Transcript_3618/g.5544  ORF Transcript_3618/g.5544 Transcript_3618/m.5544 type:complete len:222 (-) Transcript_3618:1421-2086(-)